MALITDMGTTPQSGGILHPLVKNKWRIDFYNVGGTRGVTSAGTTQSDILTLQAVSGSRPKLSFEEIVLHRYNSTGYIAGKHKWEPVTFMFEADITGLVATVFQQQLEKQQALISPGAGQVMNSATSGQQYKFAMIVSMMDGDVTALEQWAYEGAWISGVEWGDIDMAISEAVKVNTTFRYDNARQLIIGTSVGGNATGGMAPLAISN